MKNIRPRDVKILIFIPARGGSKGIIGKNLQEIGADSLVARAIRTASSIRSRYPLVEIVVSTDDERISREAYRNDAQVHKRPDFLCQDDSSTEDALLHYLQEIPVGSLDSHDVVIMMQCTSPMTMPFHLIQGVEQILSGYDSSFIGVENHFWLYEESGGSYRPIGHILGKRPSRQQVKPRVHETGAAYFFTVESFLTHRYRVHGKIGCVEVGTLGFVDIDEAKDLNLAKALVTAQITDPLDI